MKKFLKVLCAICLVISCSLILFACGKESVKPKILQTPENFGYTNNGKLIESEDPNEREYEYNDYLLVVEKNKNAYKYRFYITDNENYNDLTKYISFESENNYLDVNEIFVNKKEYHFYVQYLGKGNYRDSACSTIKSFTPENEIVKTPYLQLINNKIYWTKILYADSYDIYETVTRDNNIVTNKQKIASTNNSTFEYDITNRVTGNDAPYLKYQYEIIANAKGFYGNSNTSNKVEYIKNITLDAPSNLKVEKNNESFKLSWDSILYATKYEVKIPNGEIIEVSSNELDVTSYITSYAGYTFSVKAKESDVLSYNSSEFSLDYLYNNTTKLSAPTNLNVTTEGEYIIVSFDDVLLASNGYTIIVTYSNNVVFTSNNFTSGTRLRSTDLIGELTEDKTITIQIYANQVGSYIFESEKTSTDYIIRKPVTE